MDKRKRGRVAADGAKIVGSMTVKLSVDQIAKDVLDQFLEETDGNLSAAIRALCHAYARMSERAREDMSYVTAGRTAGGHGKSITTRAAAEPEFTHYSALSKATQAAAREVGEVSRRMRPESLCGHAKTNTQVSGAGGAAKRERVVQPAPVEGSVTRAAARQAVIDAREKNNGGLLSEYTREGTRKSITTSMRDKDAFERGERTAW